LPIRITLFTPPAIVSCLSEDRPVAGRCHAPEMGARAL
jgi:hypothetical protein